MMLRYARILTALRRLCTWCEACTPAIHAQSELFVLLGLDHRGVILFRMWPQLCCSPPTASGRALNDSQVSALHCIAAYSALPHCLLNVCPLPLRRVVDARTSMALNDSFYRHPSLLAMGSIYHVTEGHGMVR
jgi:hypothetical protein